MNMTSNWQATLYPGQTMTPPACPNFPKYQNQTNETSQANDTSLDIPASGPLLGTAATGLGSAVMAATALTVAGAAALAAGLTSQDESSQNCSASAPLNPAYVHTGVASQTPPFGNANGSTTIANTSNLVFLGGWGSNVDRASFVSLLDAAQQSVDQGVKPSLQSLILINGTLEFNYTVVA